MPALQRPPQLKRVSYSLGFLLNTIIIEKKEEEAADVDMGGLFGDEEY